MLGNPVNWPYIDKLAKCHGFDIGVARLDLVLDLSDTSLNVLALATIFVRSNAFHLRLAKRRQVSGCLQKQWRRGRQIPSW